VLLARIERMCIHSARLRPASTAFPLRSEISRSVESPPSRHGDAPEFPCIGRSAQRTGILFQAAAGVHQPGAPMIRTSVFKRTPCSRSTVSRT